MRRVLAKYILAPAIALAVASTASGQSSEVVTELDPGIAVGVELSKQFRLDFFAGREKSDELESGKWKASAGVSFRVKPLFKTFLDNLDSDKQHVLVVGTIYEYSRASEAGQESVEHKLMLDATARYAFGSKFLASDRSRFEFRWIEGEHRFRYRNRLMLERESKVKAFRFTPYTGAEAFWDKKFSKWNQFRFTGGVQIPLIRRTSIDLYYERARCTTCANRDTNVFGATFNVFFRRKK